MGTEVSPDTANVALMMEREIDKRVVMALMRMVDPTDDDRIHEINLSMAETTINRDGRPAVRQMFGGMFAAMLLSDARFMHELRATIVTEIQYQMKRLYGKEK